MTKLQTCPTMICVVILFFVAAVIGASAQSLVFTSLYGFNGSDGWQPEATLVQAPDGTIYGTTMLGGAGGRGACNGSCGTIFKITPAGVQTMFHSFDGFDGNGPYGGLVQASDGNLYGTTASGGASVTWGSNGSGTVFKITPAGTLTTLHSFCAQADCTDGANPFAGLVQATDGNFYGTTELGGASGNCSGGCGTFFRITPSGTLTTLHSFDGSGGANPYGALVQASDGNFYGTASAGGTNNSGTVFKITPAGTLTTLYSFCAQTGCPDGSTPYAALVQATDGNFYGTTVRGGSWYGAGTAFKITPRGALTSLHSFCASGPPCADGALPFAGLVQASDGNFYGTTTGSGTDGNGTIFKITSAGALTTLLTFNGLNGLWPVGGLVQARNGIFYGTTYAGGYYGYGTVFSLLVVRTCPTCRP
jgi:uncharacterized repeat protein (TIGR03803 family)